MSAVKKIILLVVLLLLGILAIVFLSPKEEERVEYVKYISSDTESINTYDSEGNKLDKTIVRGTKVKVNGNIININDSKYIEVINLEETYYVDIDSIVDDIKDIVREKEKYVRTSTTIYKEDNSPIIESFVKKGEKLEIIGYSHLQDDGTVKKYKVKYNDIEGYVYSKYLVDTKEEADKLYNENNLQEKLSKMGNSLGGGTATKLDYYPYEKANFKDNVMPDEVRSLYINSSTVKNIDKYITFAKENNINSFVIDIKDNTSPAYASNVMKEYSITNYNHALNSYDDYKKYIQKARDSGIYLIGRITVFKDSYFVEDHKEVSIKSANGEPFNHNGSYWPSVYNRYVWEFNVSLALEAVDEMGFNEIQFDYVRFPDRTTRLEREGAINLENNYHEDKANALQAFVMYACDTIHEHGAYVSIDVFGESASNYVTAYGQFWPAISNVADVISGMPYPDHFNTHEYGISEVVWTVPYKLLDAWGSYVKGKQEIIPTPAIVRTWIQAYDTRKNPSVVYDANKISDQIKALYKNGLTGGYMTWNSGSNLDKYKFISEAFKKEY